jgi:hypothetical protein
MTEPNPLVAQPVDEDAQPWDDLAGAGVASSWADLHAAASADDVDPLQVTYAAAAAGLDTLGAITDPLDSLLTAGLGWLIEHVWFLHEPLDALAGDPAQITAQARTWHNVGRELGAVARDHRAAAAALGAWEGAAGDGYRAAVDGFTGALERAGRDAGTLADLVLTTGAQVGTVRAAVRDAIAGFVADAIRTIAVAAVGALVTAGGALAAATLRVIWTALELADDIRRTIERLLDAMTLAGGTAAQLSGAVRQTAAAVRAARPLLSDVDEAAGGLHADEVVEAGKQFTGAEQQRREWGGAAWAPT